MTKAELSEFKKILETKQGELEHLVRNRDAITIEKSADALDEVQHASERELAVRNLDHESKLLRSVRSARRRLRVRDLPQRENLGEGVRPGVRSRITELQPQAYSRWNRRSLVYRESGELAPAPFLEVLNHPHVATHVPAINRKTTAVWRRHGPRRGGEVRERPVPRRNATILFP